MTKARKAELVRTIKQKVPGFQVGDFFRDLDLRNADEGIIVPYYVGKKTDEADDYQRLQPFRATSELDGCCGVHELYNIRPYNQPWELAALELWLHSGDASSDPAILIATTAKRPAIKIIQPEEKMLRAIGFTAVSTGLNGGSGNNVTLWVFNTGLKRKK